MRKLTLLLGAAVVGLALGGAPSASALTEQQMQTLQQAAARGETALRAALAEIVAAELAAGGSFAGVARDTMDALVGLSPDPRIQAMNAVVAVQALAEAADRMPTAGVTASEAARQAVEAALETGAGSGAFVREFVRTAAVESVASTNPYAAYLPTAVEGALETAAVPPEVRDIARREAQKTGLVAALPQEDATGGETAGDGEGDDGILAGGGGSGIGVGGTIGDSLGGGLGGIPGGVSADRAGDNVASSS